MVRWFLVPAAILTVTAPLCRSAEVVVSAEPDTVQPGDLLTVTARMTSAEYATVFVGLQPVPLLRLISREPGLVQKTDKGYVQEHRWILQAVSSGTVEWNELQATITTAEGEQSIDLPPLQIQIDPFEDKEQASDPLALPNEGDSKNNITFSLSIGAGVILLVTLIAIVAVRRAKGGAK